MKRVVKISSPFNISRFSGQMDPALASRYSFELDNDCDKCDFWIVWGDISAGGIDKMTVTCPPQNILYMTDEAYVEKKFDQRFLDQFAGVLTCRDDISHKNIIKTHEINVWQLGKKFSQLNNSTPIPKQKKLSVVCSDKTFLIGHKKRYAFVNRMIGHFKDRIDVFGHGFNPIDDKWEALAPYEYSIAIENSALPGYFTEKIAECYLAHAFPIYYGAPDISDFFDPKSYMTIDIEDYIGSIRKIEGLLEQHDWTAHESLLIKQKYLYLTEYNFFPALAKVLDRLGSDASTGKNNRVRSHASFVKYYRARKILRAARKRFRL
jgi:hypothetical protein